MTEHVPHVPEVELSPDDKESRSLALFINEHHLSADQIREAYYRLCGVSEDESEDAGVDMLLERMQKMTDEGYPINRFVSLVEAKQETEDAKETCFSYIETLPVSTNEKSVLRSIIEDLRSGELSLFVGDREYVSITIRTEKDSSSEALALRLLEELKKAIAHVGEGKTYEFAFAPE